jgi:CHAT domain-containing protein
LGDVGFLESNWQLALEGYLPAIEAVEKTRSWATSDPRRQEILEEAIDIYGNAIQCYINLKQYKEAILLAERARARHLVELMASADYQKDNLSEETAQCLEQYLDLQKRIKLLQQRSSEGSSPDSSNSGLGFTLKDLQEVQNQQLNPLFKEKEEIWQKLRRLDPVLAGTLEVPTFSWDDLCALWLHQPHTALLSFYSTNNHTHIFIVRPSSPTNPGNLTVTLHTCEEQDGIHLQEWIGTEWLSCYQTNFNYWSEQLSQKLQELATRLDIKTIVCEHLQGIQELILIPHIGLHLIPFAALPLGEGYLGEQFRLRILPSANILKYCQDRENNNPHAPLVPINNLGTIEAAGAKTDTVLSLVRLGFSLLAQSLSIPPDQRLQQQQATCDNYHSLAHSSHIKALHSIHHAKADLANPLNSALKLTDGNITLEELLSPQWRMPQIIDVMLTCCETNLGQLNLTDDLLTLGAGFLCAGARSVVSTLWQVDALATTWFCEFYYRQREQGNDRPTAVYLAQQQLRNLTYVEIISRLEEYLEVAHQNKKQEPEVYNILSEWHKKLQKQHRSRQETPYASPYFWGAFIVQGLR